MDIYDISGAFGRIEDELIASMIRNLGRHRIEEGDMGFNWVQWQAEELKTLEKYKKYNAEKYGREFENLNSKIEAAIREMEKRGGTDAEQEILKQIKNGFKPTGSGMKGLFFHANQRKLDALIKATTNDMKKAEVAILRMANDRYRRVIFDAQLYAASGAGTYEKAVDMATKDMAMSGLNCVEYKNGARHRLEDYADMAIRTAGKRAYLYGEGERRHAWGITTVIVNKRTGACPKCLPWCGKVFIDDVWSGGSAKDGDYPLLSSAVEAGLYHPRCRDSHTTYFPGISKADGKWTKKELQRIKKYGHREAEKQYTERQVEKWHRVANTRLDPENEIEAELKAKKWETLRGLAASDGSYDVPEHDPPEYLGNIAIDNSEDILKALGWFAGKYRNEKEEHAIVISSDGRMHLCHGDSKSVYPDYDLDEDDLRGSIVSHNHPEEETEYSFSSRDVSLFLNYDIAELYGCDVKYNYRMSRKDLSVDEFPTNWNIFENMCHGLRIRDAHNYKFGYQRKKND